MNAWVRVGTFGYVIILLMSEGERLSASCTAPACPAVTAQDTDAWKELLCNRLAPLPASKYHLDRLRLVPPWLVAVARSIKTIE